MVLKFQYRLGYEMLCAEAADVASRPPVRESGSLQ
jgi:hypothetical protein